MSKTINRRMGPELGPDRHKTIHSLDTPVRITDGERAIEVQPPRRQPPAASASRSRSPMPGYCVQMRLQPRQANGTSHKAVSQPKRPINRMRRTDDPTPLNTKNRPISPMETKANESRWTLLGWDRTWEYWQAALRTVYVIDRDGRVVPVTKRSPV